MSLLQVKGGKKLEYVYEGNGHFKRVPIFTGLEESDIMELKTSV